jgi:hypothetical protein
MSFSRCSPDFRGDVFSSAVLVFRLINQFIVTIFITLLPLQPGRRPRTWRCFVQTAVAQNPVPKVALTTSHAIA